jgi:hypothetical protein
MNLIFSCQTNSIRTHTLKNYDNIIPYIRKNDIFFTVGLLQKNTQEDTILLGTSSPNSNMFT